ncbi:hypothetical protein G5B19_14625 [Enterocloster clostridioformis]|uniref:Band 7 domain-containing protein n=2 Tax=Enterocloster clostridioformis TaxID=1531 RepID=A0ABD6LKW5_9FIRM|nr:SPFH domain-containing protein [Enterocloster clostridioformis]MBE7716020.1 hypothetical protein [Enterocloster clostridioformis]NSD57009.1 hypothetical protein [Enterocloster clostridioformis]NSJ11027.1 hypothetical protein [Enterocloster clostridioformis]NSJ19916.1 hypothetical protein [Enterocloster clostridioformis]NSJ31746.1 hypothetical protein [Enterocloster clostridioformis]
MIQSCSIVNNRVRIPFSYRALTLRAINTDRDSFSDQVMINASKDMEKLGIDILSCNIQNVTDEHGLIQDLGMDNTSKIRKDASIAKAEART